MTDIKSMLLSELQEDFALRGLQKLQPKNSAQRRYTAGCISAARPRLTR